MDLKELKERYRKKLSELIAEFNEKSSRFDQLNKEVEDLLKLYKLAFSKLIEGKWDEFSSILKDSPYKDLGEIDRDIRLFMEEISNIRQRLEQIAAELDRDREPCQNCNRGGWIRSDEPIRFEDGKPVYGWEECTVCRGRGYLTRKELLDP